MAVAVFDNSLVTVNVVVDGAPQDVTAGLNFDGDFFKFEKSNKDETVTRKGLKNSSYTAIATSDSERNVELTWIPGSPAIQILDTIMKNKKTFNLVVAYSGDPKFLFSGAGEDCTIMEEPSVTVNGKSGWENTTYKIKCPTSTYNYL